MQRLFSFLKTNKPIDNETKVHVVLFDAVKRYINSHTSTNKDGAIIILNLAKLLDISIKRRNMLERMEYMNQTAGIKIPSYIEPAITNMSAYISRLMNIEPLVYRRVITDHPNMFSDNDVKAMIGKYLLRPLVYNKHYLRRIMEIAKRHEYIPISPEDILFSLPTSGKYPISSFSEPVFSGKRQLLSIKELANYASADVLIKLPEQKKTMYALALLRDIFPDPETPRINENALRALNMLGRPRKTSIEFIMDGFGAIIRNNRIYDPKFTIQFVISYPDNTFQTLLYHGKETVTFKEFDEKAFLTSFPQIKPAVISYWKKRKSNSANVRIEHQNGNRDNGGYAGCLGDCETAPMYARNVQPREELLPDNSEQLNPGGKISVNDASDIINFIPKWASMPQMESFKYNVEVLSPNVESDIIYKYIENYVSTVTGKNIESIMAMVD